MKSPTIIAAAVAIVLLLAMCAAVCPEVLRAKTCHDETTPSNSKCLDQDFLTQKTFIADGFVLPTGFVTIAPPEPIAVASFRIVPATPTTANLRSVVLRI